MSAAKKKSIHIVIMFALYFIVSHLSPFGVISEMGMKVLGVFVMTLYGWIFIDLAWSSLLGMIMLSVIGYAPISKIVAIGLGNATTLMVIAALMFAYGLQQVAFTDWLVNWFMTRKIIKGNPWRLVIGIIVISYILGLTCGLAGIFIMWILIVDIAEKAGYQKGDSTIAFLVSMVVIALVGAGNTLPWKSGPITFGGYFSQASDLAIPFAPFLIYTTVLTVLGIAVMIIFAKICLKIDVSRLVMPDEKIEEMRSHLNMQPKQKIGLAATIFYALCFILPGFFPQWPGMKFLASEGVLGISLIFIVALWAIKDENGEPLIDLEKACGTGVSWSLVWLLAVTFPLAEAMMNGDIGIIATISQVCAPLFSSLGVVAFYVLAMVVAGVVTQVAHNIVLAAVLYPVLCPIAIQIGANPYALFMMTYMALIAAYGTPAASVNGAMVHGQPWAAGKAAYIIGWAFLAITFILNLVVGIPLANILF